MAIRPNNAADPEVATVGEDGKLVFSRFENGAVESIGRRLVDLYQGFPLVHACRRRRDGHKRRSVGDDRSDRRWTLRFPLLSQIHDA
ncbi:hypothetical protein BC936DRAFT_143973 [Jimgerdemannia flammicorona]|uniref:Uncharacterized protein n=1 Tax=Jimgerdemannia flammicorona TaxID=994334 RepID=A0A433DD68_9FUNG|nr:hypothetical protein BC936DRAFT_143973 [Jimgerdemannia flammicorona]